MTNVKRMLTAFALSWLIGSGLNTAYAQLEPPKLDNCFLDCAVALRLCTVGLVREIGDCMQGCGGDSVCHQLCLGKINEHQECAMSHKLCATECNEIIIKR